MPELTVLPEGRTIEFASGRRLMDILLENGVFVDNPCSGNGICGKCGVRITKGTLPPPEETEKRFLSEEALKDGFRLSCMVFPEDDLTVLSPREETGHDILTGGYLPPFAYHPAISKTVVRHADGTVNTQVFRFGSLIAEEDGDTSASLYGAAIDIGTTTVACALTNLTDGSILSESTGINAQKHFGLDVLTRITYETVHGEEGIAALKTAMVDSLNEMIAGMCREAGISHEQIYEITVAANTTMLHMLLGVDARPIGKAPYRPAFLELQDLPAKEAGLAAADCARLVCLPSVSAYIGADIVCGAYVCGLAEAEDNVLFIDIGTNGEIVLSLKGRLLTCSCAAGPALEGMNISSGMRAAAGAVEDMTLTKDGLTLSTIGNRPPEGLCGSGILAAMRELLKNSIVRKNGTFIKPDTLPPGDYRLPYIKMDGKKRKFELAAKPVPLYVTQDDVRQIQLAKGAILTGFTALLKKAGIEMSELDRVLIAGQFGAHLPEESLTGTGILPAETAGKITYVGNTSRIGAYMALMSTDVRDGMCELSGKMEYLELSQTENFDSLFASCLAFPIPEEG